MPNAFEVLAADHEEVLRLLAELEVGPAAAAGATSGQLALRQQLVQQLVIVESKHEAVEEMYFWPVVRERLANGDSLADLAQDQEQQGKFILDRLDKVTSPEHEEFDDQIAHFIQTGRAHIAFEEETVWPALRAALTVAEAENLGRELEDGKENAPTRPHPNTPLSPGLLKVAGAVVAAADRLRDAAIGRDGLADQP